tara:strand:- start:8727 stop:9203 length:477 start_codon:yes stop_codon:yes gene_type:complete
MNILKNKKFYIGLARFNNQTSEENKRWREDHNWEGCIYTPRQPIAKKVSIKAFVVVLEMNNEKNKLNGISLIQNYRYPKQRVKIYSGNWQSEGKPYHSKYRIDVSEFKEEDKEIITSIEKRLFYGCNHYKRSPSQINTIDIKKFCEPEKVEKFLRNLF